MRLILLGLLLYCCCVPLGAQSCDSSEIEVEVIVQCDQFGEENYWRLENHNRKIYERIRSGEYVNNSLNRHELCLPSDECFSFLMYDEYGDGIKNGYFMIIVAGDTIRSDTSFTDFFLYQFNCWKGAVCQEALPIQTGEYTASMDQKWFSFTPDTTGLYELSTCDSTRCNSTIWIYDACQPDYKDTNEGTLFYNDDNQICGEHALVTGAMKAGNTYLIRIEAFGADCLDTEVDWILRLKGLITGCTDPQSCNFDPLASVDDGSCIAQGSNDCPDGPDLVLMQDVFESSIYLDEVKVEDNCLVSEKCVRGYGKRDVIRFSTRIYNQGEVDFYMGNPETNREAFSYDNCHGHFHYEGYAEYLLYDAEGKLIPLGYKTGFCLADLICDPGVQSKYSCEDMGISSGCYDEYKSHLDCQWIDITGIPTGQYWLVARINWSNTPDALGRKEKRLDNNIARVCLTIDRNTAGQFEITQLSNCEVLTDCMGEQLGDAQPDCSGVCEGIAIYGDVNDDQQQNQYDINQYLSLALDDYNSQNPAPGCFDLNVDEAVSVYDVCLYDNCLQFQTGHIHSDGGIHDHCQFPLHIQNPYDSAQLEIHSINYEEGYLDIGLTNRQSDIKGLQFTLSGLQVDSLTSFTNDNVIWKTSLLNKVVGMASYDTLALKSYLSEPVCRVYFSDPESTICLHTEEVVNVAGELVTIDPSPDCLFTTSVNRPVGLPDLLVYPVPTTDQVFFDFLDMFSGVQLSLYDMKGQQVFWAEYHNARRCLVSMADLPTGVYSYQLVADRGVWSGKVVVY